MNCRFCGQALQTFTGLGGLSETICVNTACPGKHRNVECPKCSSIDKQIKVLGIGHFQFTCNECGNIWMNFENGSTLGDFIKNI